MGYNLHLRRFAKDGESLKKIKGKEWRQAAEELEKARVVADAMLLKSGEVVEKSWDQIEYFSREEWDWKPLLLYSEQDGYGTTTGRFEMEDVLPLLRELAETLGAFVYGDEGEVYFIPDYGDVKGNISMTDVREGIKTFGTDWKAIFQRFAR